LQCHIVEAKLLLSLHFKKGQITVLVFTDETTMLSIFYIFLQIFKNSLIMFILLTSPYLSNDFFKKKGFKQWPQEAAIFVGRWAANQSAMTGPV
jgi:hypothetical protein